ncbi:uncharacterized protein N7498_009104 [Penicillium cinerascens]|uniref:Uncharacterized protein n=1 Tax=Penicillium cinerascens TaxID=70096 RepID=A0A9W9M640_9EURO|nr:uncharacterized protein N7498_009104 [Penicillium cinerascens]KAJ5190119.1 hypothetical protein N7498_009104 [Penicillium cinerascens]
MDNDYHQRDDCDLYDLNPLIYYLTKDLETIEDGASVEIDLALDAIKQLYDQLDFLPPGSGERSVQAAALQDSETTEDFANVMRQINPAIRIHIPTTGLPAIFVDRSTSELETVATWLEKSILNGSRQHSGSMPRVCFVDEFVIEQLTWLVQQRLDWIADLLTSTFPSLKKKGLSVTADKLSRLIVLQSTDSIDPETIGPVASQVTKSYHGILLIPTTSLDHGIDLWNKVNNGMPSPAIYVFGGGKETWYLSQFINSEHCFVNCIPPRSFCMIAPSSSHDTFALPFRPDNFSRNKVILQDSNLNYQGSRHGYLNLKKISQPKGGRLSYFEQGLIVGLSVTAIAASTFAFTIFKGLKQVYY